MRELAGVRHRLQMARRTVWTYDPPMDAFAGKRFAITGASGLVGTALRSALEAAGAEVHGIGRRERQPGDIVWDPEAGTLPAESLEGLDGVVHLAGESVAKRWTEARKQRIRASRIKGTRLLAETLARLEQAPDVLVSASAVGYYGSRGDEVLSDSSSRGEGFLADVCHAWEEAAQPAIDAGIRVVHPRIGIVLATEGGALEKMLTPFKMGVGGKLGDGQHYMSWIHIDDVVSSLMHAINTPSMCGPFNCSASGPVTNAVFTKALGAAIKRPTAIPLPRIAAKLAFGGEQASEMLFASQRAVPELLLAHGWTPKFSNVDAALADLLGA